MPKSASLPLRILLVSGTPEAHPDLRIDDEVRGVLGAVQRVRNITVDVLTNPTLAALNGALATAGRGHFDVLHYIGHGRGHRDCNSGTLSFAGEHSRFHAVHPTRFANVIRDRGIGLIVLNASEGARTGVADPFAGVALSLSCVVPAVIAMQYEQWLRGDRLLRWAVYGHCQRAVN